MLSSSKFKAFRGVKVKCGFYNIPVMGGQKEKKKLCGETIETLLASTISFFHNVFLPSIENSNMKKKTFDFSSAHSFSMDKLCGERITRW